MLLAFISEGACEIEEGLLTEVLEASARLVQVVDPLKVLFGSSLRLKN